MVDHQGCHELLDSLSGYIDGEVSQALCEQIERHMEGCENCRIVVDTLKQTVSLYQQTVPPPGVPVEVRERLYRRLDLADLLDAEGKKETSR